MRRSARRQRPSDDGINDSQADDSSDASSWSIHTLRTTYSGIRGGACWRDATQQLEYIGIAMTIVVYQKPTCTTCRQVHAALKESGVDFESVDYYSDPIPRTKLIDLLRKMGIRPRELLRAKEEVYRTLKLGDRTLSDDEIIDLMVEHPDLIQRPIVEKGAKAILARPAARLKDIL
jgi:arsenate reductase